MYYFLNYNVTPFTKCGKIINRIQVVASRIVPSRQMKRNSLKFEISFLQVTRLSRTHVKMI